MEQPEIPNLKPETTSETTTDEDLIRFAKLGHALAFDELINRYHDRMFHIALCMLGDYHEALEATQDLFIKSWRSLPRFEGRSKFSTWLYRILVNECFSRRKRFARHNRLFKESFQQEVMIETEKLTRQYFNPSDDTRGMVIQNEYFIRILGAMNKMSQKSRSMIALRDVEGLSYDEIASILGCRVGTVRSRLNRARTQLKDYLNSDAPPFPTDN